MGTNFHVSLIYKSQNFSPTYYFILYSTLVLSLHVTMALHCYLHRVEINEVNREVDASGKKAGPVTLATVNGLAQ